MAKDQALLDEFIEIKRCLVLVVSALRELEEVKRFPVLDSEPT